MGSLLSRRIAGVEDIDIQANSAYRYPPKSGEAPRWLRPPPPSALPLLGRAVASRAEEESFPGAGQST